MYIASSDNFYVFNPDEIKEIKENKRGNATMINFSIREGLNLLKISEKKSEEEKNEGFQDFF